MDIIMDLMVHLNAKNVEQKFNSHLINQENHMDLDQKLNAKLVEKNGNLHIMDTMDIMDLMDH